MLKLFFSGDIFLGSEGIETLAESNLVEPLFNGIIERIQKADLAFANLESPATTSTGETLKKGPHLKTTPDALKCLRTAGFDVLTLANNHILDYGYQGLKDTLDACRLHGLKYLGAGLDVQELSRPLVLDKEGESFTFFNYCENEFSTPLNGKQFGANPLNLILNYRDISRAKRNGSTVIVIVHGGREHFVLPTPNFRETLRFFVDCGADLVVAHHTHCPGVHEVYKGKQIFYGLGNFLFRKRKEAHLPFWNVGYGLEIDLDQKQVANYSLIPFEQCLGDQQGLQLLKGEKRVSFEKEMTHHNQVIQNDQAYLEAWDQYIEQQQKSYLKGLFVHNSWVKKLVNRNIIPLEMFIKKHSLLTKLNYIKCESHREILMASLEKKYKDYDRNTY